ncbi:restriction endonuclease [candidate division KSB1 bacterium]|nr:restriction endonuclease [candidate division KSB1 bacterium]
MLTNKDEFNGLTPINIINLRHLNFREQAFVVGQIAYMINFWMRELGESDEPQLIFYIDEIGGGGSKEAFFPSVAKPPSKPALNLLLRQGRSFGVSCVFATQSPNDIDFKALANCRTWMVGQLRSNRERNNIRQGISNADFRSDAYIQRIADLSPAHFLVTAPSFPHGQKWKIFNERWLMSLHKGLSDKEIEKINNAYEEEALYRYNLAQKKLSENKIKEAEDLLLSLIKGFRFSRNRSNGYLALAQLYYKVGRTKDAIELLSKLLQESIDMEDLTKAHFLIGKCHLRDKNFKEAVAALELAIELSTDETDNAQIIRYLEYSKSQAEWEELSIIKKLARWIFDKKTRKIGLLIEQLQDDNIEIIPFSSKMVYADLTYYEQIDYELLTIEFEIAEKELDAQEIVNQQKAHDYVSRRLSELSTLIYKNELAKAKELSEKLVSRLVSSNVRSPSEFLNLLKSLNEKLRDADEQKLRKIININARQFEYEVASLFSNKGFHTIVTNQTGDDGVDVFAFQNQEKYLIQCKRYSKTKSIGRSIVDELIGTFTRYKEFTKAILITTSYFTDAAIKAARTTDFQIELWDSYRFRKEWLKTMQTDDPCS